MGRFYFHLQADDQIVPDDEGEDLPDLSAGLSYIFLKGQRARNKLVWLASPARAVK